MSDDARKSGSRVGIVFELKAKLHDARQELAAARRDARRERATHEMTLTSLKVRLTRLLELDDQAAVRKEIEALLDGARLALSCMLDERKKSLPNNANAKMRKF